MQNNLLLNILDGSGRHKFNAYTGLICLPNHHVVKSNRVKVKSNQIESPLSQIESHSVQIESQRVSNRDLNRITSLILPITEQLTIARALAVQLPVLFTIPLIVMNATHSLICLVLRDDVCLIRTA